MAAVCTVPPCMVAGPPPPPPPPPPPRGACSSNRGAAQQHLRLHQAAVGWTWPPAEQQRSPAGDGVRRSCGCCAAAPRMADWADLRSGADDGEEQQEEEQEEEEEEEELVLGEEAVADWSARARARAIRAVRERDLPVSTLLDEDATTQKKKKKRRKKKKKGNSTPVDAGSSNDRAPKSASGRASAAAEDRARALMESPLAKGLSELSGLGSYWKSLSDSSAGKIRVTAAKGSAESEERGSSIRVIAHTPPNGGSRVYSPTSRQKQQEDFDLNRRLIGAADANEVLSVVGDALEDGLWGQDESPLSAFNVSTALHRIAKHMETESMQMGDRLAFARKKGMAQLVGAAIERLPKCSAQGISNIAWALSKVGGHALYWTEMDLVAESAMAKIAHLEPQHVANIAGALASMQHSVPPLFEALDERASFYHRDFRSQELAQLLWAFATLNQPARLLLDSLDSECPIALERLEDPSRTSGGGMQKIESEDDDSLPCYSSDSFLTETELDFRDYGAKNSDVKARPSPDTRREVSSPRRRVPSKWVSAKEWFEDCSLSQLASLSWSYTVLGQLDRPSFALVWQAILNHRLGLTKRMTDLPCLRLQSSQLYQTNLSLQLEFPHLGLSLGQPLAGLVAKEWENTKSGLKLTSVGQLDVERLLVGTGQRWVAEYVAVDYSLDAALVEKKIGLEFDGPSHFARNTGTPQGHTMLKRRQLAAAGWTVLSIPFHEWDEQRGEKEQKFYLYGLLNKYL